MLSRGVSQHWHVGIFADHLKLHFPLAFSAGILAQSVIESQTVCWACPYFLCHISSMEHT
jgi:hypothetical protein